jgi:hypothetical protein
MFSLYTFGICFTYPDDFAISSIYWNYSFTDTWGTSDGSANILEPPGERGTAAAFSAAA